MVGQTESAVDLSNRRVEPMLALKLSGARFLASCLDAILQFFLMGCGLFIFWLFSALVMQLKPAVTSVNAGSILLVIAFVSLAALLGVGEFCVAIFFGPWFESSSLEATPGKRLLGLKVATTANTRMSFAAGIWREIIQVILCLITSFFYCVGSVLFANNQFANTIVSILVACFDIAVCITVFFTFRKQTVYDVLSDRVVFFAGHFPGKPAERVERIKSKSNAFVTTILVGSLCGAMTLSLSFLNSIKGWLSSHQAACAEMDKAVQCIEADNVDASKAHLEKAKRLESSIADTYTLLPNSPKTEAVRTAQIMLEPLEPAPLERRGEIYAKKNQTEDAINDFSAAIALSRKKNYATATWMTRNELAQEYLTRSGLYERDGNWTEVLADAKSALDLNPSISSAHGVEAKALDALRKPVEAKRELSLQKVMNRFDSNTPAEHCRLGIVSAVSEHSFQINQNITLEPSIDSSGNLLFVKAEDHMPHLVTNIDVSGSTRFVNCEGLSRLHVGDVIAAEGPQQMLAVKAESIERMRR